MLMRLVLFALMAGALAPSAMSEHQKTAPDHEVVVHSQPCCLSVEGETAEVLISPSHDAVRRIQAELAVRGFNPGHIDGILGPKTNRAMRNFQRSEGLVEGLLTVETLSKLGIAVRGHRHIHTHHGHSQVHGCGSYVAHTTTHSRHSGCHTVTERRVIRRHVTSTPEPPDPEPVAELLPNYVGSFNTHTVEALTWAEKTVR